MIVKENAQLRTGQETRQFQYSPKTSNGQETLEAAKRYLGAGLSIIPCDPESKKPTIGWKPYQESLITDASQFQWPGIAVICGKVSGNLECLDFDQRAAWFEDWARLVTDETPDLISKLLIQKTQSGGLHLVYRCTEPIPGNQKLASDQGGKCYIETRGTGGYFLAAPTTGYSITQGDFLSLPIISASERAIFINSARALNQKAPEPERIFYHYNNGDRRPGDLFNEQGQVLPILEQYGWKQAGAKGSITHLTRPGKSRGISATLYDGKILHVFTSNGSPFEMEKSYYPFSVYALLKHGGDFEAAAKELAQEGYSEPKELERYSNEIPTNEIIAEAFDGQKGCADLFIKLFKGKFCYDHSEDNWYQFCGHFWKREDIGKHYREATDKVQDLFTRAISELDSKHLILCKKVNDTQDRNEAEKLKHELSAIDTQLKTIRKTKAQLNGLFFRRQIIEFSAQGERSLGITGNEWDNLPWALPCLNGVIDLKTGELSPGKPENYLRSVCPTQYDPEARAPLFEKTVLEIFDGSLDLALFFQRIIGMALVGADIENKLIILHGAGRNGKDTLLELFSLVFGSDLAGAIQSETLLDSGRTRSSGGPSADIIRLRGLRLAWASETNDGRRLDSGKVKLLTGGGELTGRAPHAKRYISFKPSHTLFLLTNNKPHASTDDYALWKRILPIPFNIRFIDNPEKPNERQRNKYLPDKLKAEAEGVLAWAVEGCLEWQRFGLKPPQEVITAYDNYKAEEDTLGQFINETCMVGTEYEAKAGLLYNHYKKWMEDNNLKPLSGVKFGQKMTDRFEKIKQPKGLFYQGIGIIDNAGYA